MQTCVHPKIALRRFQSTCAWIDANGIFCSACRSPLVVYFFPDSDDSLIPAVVVDRAWFEGESGFDWTDEPSKSLEELVLEWELVDPHLPAQSQWIDLRD